MPRKQTKRKAEIALLYAIRNIRLDEVQRLLSEGVDPNALAEKTNNFKHVFTLTQHE